MSVKSHRQTKGPKVFVVRRSTGKSDDLTVLYKKLSECVTGGLSDGAGVGGGCVARGTKVIRTLSGTLLSGESDGAGGWWMCCARDQKVISTLLFLNLTATFRSVSIYAVS
jgi:hypothetical protein